MHARKARFHALADAFVVLPGGLGTLEEMAEIATWAQIGIHDSPIGFLDVDGYFDALFAWFDRAVDDGFLRAVRPAPAPRRPRPRRPPRRGWQPRRRVTPSSSRSGSTR